MSATRKMMRRREAGRDPSRGNRWVIPSVSITKMPAATSIRMMTRAAIIEMGMPRTYPPPGTSSDMGRATSWKFTSPPNPATATTNSEMMNRLSVLTASPRSAASSPRRIFSYRSM